MNLISIFKTVLLLSSMGSILAVLIIFIKYLFRYKLGAHWHFYIWFLLIIRLAIPYELQSPLSVFNLFNTDTKNSIIYHNLQENINSNVTVNKGTDSDTALPASFKDNNSMQLTKNIPGNSDIYLAITSEVWLVIAIILALYFISINILSAVKIRKQPHCNRTEIIKIFEECKSTMIIYSNIPIIYDIGIKSPSLFGFIYPRILLSPEALEKLSKDELKYIFLHELVHFKRKDILLNWISIFLLIINWFNPILWYAFYLMRQDCEVSCDAYVLSYLNLNERKEYGKTIINLLNFTSKTHWKPGFTSIIDHKSNVRRRIIMITKFKNKSLKMSIIAICLLLGLGAVGLTNSTSIAKTINGKDISNENINGAQIAKKFLPQNSSIIDPQDRNVSDFTLQKDLDGDGKAEIMCFYKLNNQDTNPLKLSVLVLKEVNGKWTKALDVTNPGVEIRKTSKGDVYTEGDVDGDGKNELLLGFSGGVTWSELYIYKWENNSLKQFTNQEMTYLNLDIINTSASKKAALALWSDYPGNANVVEILQWNGNKFVSVKNAYPDYFKTIVIPYYENQVKELPKIPFLWYDLADAQITAGEKEAAKNSIAKGISLNHDSPHEYPSKEEFAKLLEKTNK